MNQKSILICGLPASGKTTFIAALWYLLSNGEISTALTLGSLPENRNYLNNLSRKWAKVLQVDRTHITEHQRISILLNNGPSNATLNVPDMSGETWHDLWAMRYCSEDVAKWAMSSSGIILFLHSDKIRHKIDLGLSNAMIESLGEQPTDSEFVPWSPDSTPTQVVLVDLLQSLVYPPLGDKTRRLVVIISAWDKVEDIGQTPEDYLRYNLPLLHQFLQSSGNFSEVKIYGISAQGGDLESEEDLQKLKNEDIPSKRIKVVDGSYMTHDLTLPIQWLMK